MKIAILGAGFTGLTAAYFLSKKGHDVTIYEKDALPGGLAIGYSEKNWDWTLEKFYHHWFTNDDDVLSLASELSYPVTITRPKTSSFINGKSYQLDSPLTLLRFPLLSIVDRLRMGVVLAILRYNPFWKPLEKFSAEKVLAKWMGIKGYSLLWKPLLRNKFGDFAPSISLAWFWARIVKRTPSLAYPEGGFLRFAEALATACIKKGVTIKYNTTISSIEEKNGKVLLGNEGEFDKALVTLPSFAFTSLAKGLPEAYKKKLTVLPGIGAVVLVLRLRKKFLPDNTYWLNICDTAAPVLAIVEHTNFIDKKHYNNEHIVYLGNYLPATHPYFSDTAKELLSKFDTYLTKINPEYADSLITVEKFSVPFAQPIITRNYSKKIPPFTTPLKNVYLANMQQVYPWDRGTNYAVALGKKAASVLG